MNQIQSETGRLLVMRWILWIAFAGLCILSGTSWVIPRGATDELPPLEQQCLIFGVMGIIAFLLAGRRGWSLSLWLRYVRLGAAAVGLFGIPAVVAEYARSSVPSISRSALFAAVPVVVVLGVAAGDTTGREEIGARQFLMPALAGWGGLLLLLPLGFSGTVRGWVMLAIVCAAVVVAGLASVWLYRLLRGLAFAESVAVVGISNVVFLLVWSAACEETLWRGSSLVSVMSISSLVDVVEVLLIVWLLREMSPVRFSARYLVIPLLLVLESYVVMRPEWTVRMGFGTALLAVGAGVLLFWKAGEDEAGLSLR